MPWQEAEQAVATVSNKVRQRVEINVGSDQNLTVVEGRNKVAAGDSTKAMVVGRAKKRQRAVTSGRSDFNEGGLQEKASAGSKQKNEAIAGGLKRWQQARIRR